MVADAALGRAARGVVVDAVALEHPDRCRRPSGSGRRPRARGGDCGAPRGRRGRAASEPRPRPADSRRFPRRCRSSRSSFRLAVPHDSTAWADPVAQDHDALGSQALGLESLVAGDEAPGRGHHAPPGQPVAPSEDVSNRPRRPGEPRLPATSRYVTTSPTGSCAKTARTRSSNEPVGGAGELAVGFEPTT